MDTIFKCKHGVHIQGVWCSYAPVLRSLGGVVFCNVFVVCWFIHSVSDVLWDGCPRLFGLRA